MSSGQQGVPSSRQALVSVMTDQDGAPIMWVGNNKYLIQEPNGEFSSREVTQYLSLMDGSLWNPYSKSVALGGVCGVCRNPPFSLFGREAPRHGICSKTGGRLCAACGIYTCPRHRTRHEGAWLCPVCARRSRLARLIRALLFKRVDD